MKINMTKLLHTAELGMIKPESDTADDMRYIPKVETADGLNTYSFKIIDSEG